MHKNFILIASLKMKRDNDDDHLDAALNVLAKYIKYLEISYGCLYGYTHIWLNPVSMIKCIKILGQVTFRNLTLPFFRYFPGNK